MALDWPAFGDALWLVSDELGIRPEWQLPVIYFETAKTFDPATVNSDGCVGLNQFCRTTYPHYVSVPVDEYRTWPASRQLGGPILDYWADAVRAYGPIQSAAKLMVAQFGHAKLPKAQSLSSVIISSPSNEYSANCPGAAEGKPCGLDPTLKGYITVGNIANVLKYSARDQPVREAIAKAYAMRPGERPFDPVYGLDYGGGLMEVVNPPVQSSGGSGFGKIATGITVLLLGAAAGLGTYEVRRRTRQGTAMRGV